MYFNDSIYWDTTGSARMKKFMQEKGISEEIIAEIISEMDDVASEIRWEAKQDGAHEEFYSNSMSYMD